MWYIMFQVNDVIPSMLAKPAEILLLEFKNIKRKHLVECCGTARNIECDVHDACQQLEKLVTVQAIFIKKLNNHDECWIVN